MNEYDVALAKFLDLWTAVDGDQNRFYAEAEEKLGFSNDDVDWINTVIGSAQFRGAFGGLVRSHTTDYEDDPWFLAAQRRYPRAS